jgi:hypothetical protein
VAKKKNLHRGPQRREKERLLRFARNDGILPGFSETINDKLETKNVFALKVYLGYSF